MVAISDESMKAMVALLDVSIGTKLDSKLQPITTQISALTGSVGGIESAVAELQRDNVESKKRIVDIESGRARTGGASSAASSAGFSMIGEWAPGGIEVKMVFKRGGQTSSLSRPECASIARTLVGQLDDEIKDEVTVAKLRLEGGGNATSFVVPCSSFALNEILQSGSYGATRMTNSSRRTVRVPVEDDVTSEKQRSLRR